MRYIHSKVLESRLSNICSGGEKNARNILYSLFRMYMPRCLNFQIICQTDDQFVGAEEIDIQMMFNPYDKICKYDRYYFDGFDGKYCFRFVFEAPNEESLLDIFTTDRVERLGVLV